MKTIHNTFTMPEADHHLIQKLKIRCMKLGIDINRSELVRCGIKALEKMKDAELKNITNDLQKIRAGRPKNLRLCKINLERNSFPMPVLRAPINENRIRSV